MSSIPGVSQSVAVVADDSRLLTPVDGEAVIRPADGGTYCSFAQLGTLCELVQGLRTLGDKARNVLTVVYLLLLVSRSAVPFSQGRDLHNGVLARVGAARFPPPRVAWLAKIVGRRFPDDRISPGRSTINAVGLSLYAHPFDLQIGLKILGHGAVALHSWVVVTDQVPVGSPTDLSKYVCLPSLDDGYRL